MAFGRGGPGPMSEINVTPLVDVMLVLLIIFMVTAPLTQQGVKVELPQTDAPAMKTSTEERLVLTLTKDGRAYLGKTEVPMERLTDMLSANEKLKQDKELYLHADQTLPYGVVVKVMAAAKAGGADNLAMVTDPVSTEAPR
ncbi:MAG: ExbD/TolR family protein [Deltaproteobacteria bacterium]|nr:ExbD/TolR family protein [Deltaproteobacteria bacterium]